MYDFSLSEAQVSAQGDMQVDHVVIRELLRVKSTFREALTILPAPRARADLSTKSVEKADIPRPLTPWKRLFLPTSKNSKV